MVKVCKSKDPPLPGAQWSVNAYPEVWSEYNYREELAEADTSDWGDKNGTYYTGDIQMRSERTEWSLTVYDLGLSMHSALN
jgi:hypothetical protein